jgi:hypothetical protein
MIPFLRNIIVSRFNNPSLWSLFYILLLLFISGHKNSPTKPHTNIALTGVTRSGREGHNRARRENKFSKRARRAVQNFNSSPIGRSGGSPVCIQKSGLADSQKRYLQVPHRPIILTIRKHVCKCAFCALISDFTWKFSGQC